MLATPMLALSPLMAQSNYWVDPAHGSDGAAGTSSTAPWKTLTHAITNAAAGATVHMQPGTYGIASGETYPLEVTYSLNLVGDGDRSAVIINGAGGGFRLIRVATVGSPVMEFSDFTIDGGDSETLVSVENANLSLRNIYASGGSVGFDSCSGSTVTIDGCVCTDMSFLGVRSSYLSTMYALDSTFRNCGWAGIGIATAFGFENSDLYIARCRIEHNIGDGIRHEAFGVGDSSSITIEDSLIANNGGFGVSNFGSDGGSRLTIRSCTIADNSLGGCQGPLSVWAGSITNTIVAGNGFFDVSGFPSIFSSLIGDGSGASGTSNLAGDPRFVDPAAGDFSLRFDSPCVDQATAPSTGLGLDFNGRMRAVDGDLDLTAEPDMGAFELHTLSGPTSSRLGQPIELFVSGPSQGFATAIVNHGGFAPFGAQTPFGRLFLPSAGSFRLAPVMTTGRGPTPVMFQFPSSPALIGTSTGFQALVRSQNAPAGGALSNPILVRIDA
ncbi:right-handed parallel beta-helix repeat-containing protein [Saltatorellus ferox]|uniref:right-handed parallel beta-helix repeat-containing protein n=1 Tax=Saltatorellus ferox TaxID=2528018 RepID=UPI003AF331AF